MSKEEPHFEVLNGYPADVLAIAAHGRICRTDYEDVLIPAFEEKVRTEGKVKMLFVFGEGFSGYSVGAAWDDAKFGLLHLPEMARLAIVSDVEWLRLGVKTFAPLIPCPVALFHTHELENAKHWIAEWHDEEEPGPEVAADHTLPTLEDMG